MSDYFYCPHCDARVPEGALSCPECGSDESTGWSDLARYDGWFPDDDEASSSQPTPWVKYLVSVVAGLILVALLMNSTGAAGLWLIPILFLGIGVAYYWSEIRPNLDSSQERRLYQFLLMKARGDDALVDRLVEYERQRSPGASRRQLLQDAIERWDRDAR